MVFVSSGYSTGEELGHVLCAIVGFGSMEIWTRVRLPADKLPDAFASYRRELHRLRQDRKTKPRDKVDYSTASGVQAGDAQWTSISEFVQSGMIPGTFARVSNWALVRTALGYLGLVPAGCIVGDEVALLRDKHFACAHNGN